ncbi:sulfotransferase family protein [Pseudomonas sp. N040]|uniref:sulfotransferase family protein n=1 Tax=Pseudomonas sp. N040 TaxID=2785325 RepID=UPI0018A26E2A|nr:sulfotransferase [Pseudomonas sp. N040]MBF7731739.1 sulfotransferase domain-containing protein [Pseudomonas sp. N040]MBW7015383.1 sulfotransferase domain-containing protein [Pseudomonas sp. N040]
MKVEKHGRHRRVFRHSPAELLSAPDIRVSFILAGVQKSGTTALDLHLRSHPQVAMAKIKEVHHFDDDRVFAMPGAWLRDRIFHAHFSTANAVLRYGEATPAYLYHDRAVERMWAYNRDMKIVLVLRNPIERAFSHWNMERDRAVETLPFLQALQAESARCRESLPRQNLVYSYVDRGFYTAQIRRLWRFFPVEQTLIIKHDDLRADLQGVLARLSGFLEIDAFAQAVPRDVHSRPYIAQMTDLEREYLRNIFRFEICALEQMLGWDCRAWLL